MRVNYCTGIADFQGILGPALYNIEMRSSIRLNMILETDFPFDTIAVSIHCLKGIFIC